MNTAIRPSLLDAALDAAPAGIFEPLRGARIVITGASGFFGSWVLRGLELLNARGLGIRAQCVSRRPPAAQHDWQEWTQADAQAFADLPAASGTTHILHMAASSDARVYGADPLLAANTILDGANGCIALARRTGAHLHLVSSGAVYGARRLSAGPAEEAQMAQNAPDPLDSGASYANAKRMAESLVACGPENHSISRPFAFLGPLLPLDQHFAAGNFVRDAAAGIAIEIKGDGTPLRSYMHPADLAVWLLALTAQAPRGQAFNVGSDQAVSVSQLASEIAEAAGSPEPLVREKASPAADPSAYWPDTTRAQQLGLSLSISRAEAIQDMLAWARNASPEPASAP